MQRRLMAGGIMALAALTVAGNAMAQSDPTAGFTTRVTQVEQVSTIVAAGLLGIVDLWVLTTGAIKGQINWGWCILITVVAVIVGSYTVWKPLFI